MLLWLFRGVFSLLLVGIALLAFSVVLQELAVNEIPNPSSDGDLHHKQSYQGAGIALGVACLILVCGGIVLFTDIREKHKQIAIQSAIYFGLLLGLLLGWLFSLGIQNLLDTTLPASKVAKIFPILRVAITLICCYVTISTLLQTRDEFRFIIPYVEFSKQVKGNKPLVLDTSVIIDGRIADVCDTRIVDSRMIVPRFVLQELQGIADSSDKLKRNRGRRGLDILKKLQSNTKIELTIHDGDVMELRTAEKIRVDEKLVLFTKAINGKVVTNDFNLNKIAQLQGVDVINLNEVANALKTVALPGEYIQVKVVKQGDQIGQGVGYLDDGTMVVIEQGRNLIGQDASIMVTSVLQTPAGRMIFGKSDGRTSGTYAPVGGSVPSSAGTSTVSQSPANGSGLPSTTTTLPVKPPSQSGTQDPSRGNGR
ncbi:MAG: PIN/TRAM domain-containing protein [Gemmataceae bacterium]